MDEKDLLLSKYSQSLQAHVQAMDTIFELKHLLQKAEIRIGELEVEVRKSDETEN